MDRDLKIIYHGKFFVNEYIRQRGFNELRDLCRISHREIIILNKILNGETLISGDEILWGRNIILDLLEEISHIRRHQKRIMERGCIREIIDQSDQKRKQIRDSRL